MGGHNFVGAYSRKLFSVRSHFRFYMSSPEGSVTEKPVPTPGNPIVKNVDKSSYTAYLSVCIPGDATQKAMAVACDVFNEEVKKKGYTVPGFRPGVSLPRPYLFQIFGEDKVKLFCANLLAGDIQAECEHTGLMFVGRGRVLEFNENSFTPGKPHVVDVACDLWPTIVYQGEKGYKGLEVTVAKAPIDDVKVVAVKKSIQERYKIMGTTPVSYSAQQGDVVVADMRGFERNPDGSKGKALPAIASGDQVEIPLEKGKFMDGLIEGLLGSQTGETKSIVIKFPIKSAGPGAAMSGKEAVFEVNVLGVKTKSLPTWDDELAGRIRDGMTLAELDQEVRKAVEGEGGTTENLRNDKLANALLSIVDIDQIPASLMEEQFVARFQSMLTDFKEQGSTDEQLEEMATQEKFEKFKEISRVNVEKVVKLGMVFRDIAEKESISVQEKEIQEQLDLLAAQAKQKGEAPPDQNSARDEIENALLRRKVFDCLAGYATIDWVEELPPPPQAE